MANQVNKVPFFPRPPIPVLQAIVSFAQDLIAKLQQEFVEHAQRLNGALPKDGTEAMTAPLPMMSFTIANLPTASLWAGAIVYVSNGASNKRLAVSDGTIWRYPDGGAV